MPGLLAAAQLTHNIGALRDVKARMLQVAEMIRLGERGL